MKVSAERLFSNDWESLRSVISEGNNFLITTHVNADPDALGSELALAEALRLINKKSFILNPTAIAKNYRFLDPLHEVTMFQESSTNIAEMDLDGAFIMDISRWERLGSLSDVLQSFTGPKTCIDHHPYTGGFANFHLINTNACATAEIVYDLLDYLNIPLNQRIAECLYASILADTGSFSFSNTNARSHEIASNLLSYGISSRTIFEHLFQNHTTERLKFLGKILSGLQVDCDGRLAWMSVGYDILKNHNLTQEDLEGFVDLPRNCREVLLSILFVEVEHDDIKVSLRAKGDFNANQLAGHFGGGGHNHASGIRMAGPLKEVEQLVLNEARNAMRPFLLR